MTELRKVGRLDNMVEAQLLGSLLDKRGISHLTRTYHDSACDGIFQGMKGWGHVKAADQDRAEILAILAALRTRAAETTDECE